MMTGAMLLPASFVFGLLYEHAGAGPAFAFSAGCALAAGALLWRWLPPTGTTAGAGGGR